MFPPFIAVALEVRIEFYINALFNDADADVSSSFLRSYVLRRCAGNSFIGKLLEITNMFVHLLMIVDTDLI